MDDLVQPYQITDFIAGVFCRAVSAYFSNPPISSGFLEPELFDITDLLTANVLCYCKHPPLHVYLFITDAGI